MIQSLAIFGAVLTVLIVLVGWQFHREKKFQNNLYVWQRFSLYKRGAIATGTLLNEVEVRTFHGGRIPVTMIDYVVDVRPAAGEPWRVSMRYVLTGMQTDQLRSAGSVPLRYDAQNREHIVIDWPALENRDGVEDAAKKQQALAEREALLSGKPGPPRR